MSVRRNKRIILEDRISFDRGLPTHDSGTKNALVTDSSTKNALVTDSGTKNALVTDSGTKNALVTDSGTKNALNGSDKATAQTNRFVKFTGENSDVGNSNRSKSRMFGCNGDELHGYVPDPVPTHTGQDNSSLSFKEMIDLMSIPNIMDLMGFRCFNFCFRFFPPLMFLRWTLDFWLILCEATLALLTDHNRVAYTRLQEPKKAAAGEDGKSGCQKQRFDSDGRSGQSKMGTRAPRDDSKKSRRTTPAGNVTCNGPRVSTPRIGGVTDTERNPTVVAHSNGRHHASPGQDKTATSVYNGFPQAGSHRDEGTRQQRSLSHGLGVVVLCCRLFLLYLIMTCVMPVVRRAVIFLSHLSFMMHTLAGLDEFDDQDEKNQRVFLYKHLLRQLPAWLGKDVAPGSVRQIRPEEWLIGHVVVRGIREMSKFPCLRSNFLATIAKRSRRLSVMETAKAIVMQIQEESFIDLPSYLASDQEYEEDQDSSYVHSDASSSEEECDTEESLDEEAIDLLVSLCEHSDYKPICRDVLRLNCASPKDCPKKDMAQQKILRLMDLLKVQEQEPTTVKTVEEPIMEDPTMEDPTMEEPTMEDPPMEEPTMEYLTMEERAVDEPTIEEPMTEQPAVDLASLGENAEEKTVLNYETLTSTHPIYERTISAPGDDYNRTT
ncbi:unnamed protein product [Lymnaea stagnalis]|uniref:Uncharacterized protein n=1 Tax=Lymnaea stagnalis TaxID=6523 RepID=A0AAV2HNG5_LYMST